MSDPNSLDLSIQLQENQQKSKEQELEEFVLLTNKIAQSDRNNDLLRQIKKSKANELNKIRTAHRQVIDQNGSLQSELDKLSDSIKEVKNTHKVKNDYFEELTKKYEELALKERQTEDKNTALSRDNEKLQKKVMSLQAQYDEVLKTNKERSNYLLKLKKKRDIQEQIITQSEKKIEQLESVCESTKNKAVQIQQALARQLAENEQLERTVAEKEQQIQMIRHEREQNSKKQEESKRNKKQMKAKLQKMEDEIGRKMQQLQRLHKLHFRLQKQIQKGEQSQTFYEQMLVKRRELVDKLRKDSNKLKRQKEGLKQIKQL